jgi:hypothetical protein
LFDSIPCFVLINRQAQNKIAVTAPNAS